MSNNFLIAISTLRSSSKIALAVPGEVRRAGGSALSQVPVGGIQGLFGPAPAAVAAVAVVSQRRFPGLLLNHHCKLGQVAAGKGQS